MKKNILNVFRVILTIIFTIVYFTSLSALLTLFILKDALKNDMLKEIILGTMNAKTISYEVDDKTLAYLDVDDVISEINKTNPQIEINDELSTYLQDTFGDVLKEYNIPEDTLKYIMEDEENKDIIASLMQDTLNYTYGISDNLEITDKDIEKLINNSIDIYESKNNVTIDRKKINALSKEFTEEYKNVLDSTNIGEMEKIKDTINISLNGKIFYYILSTCIISFIFLIIINIKHLKVLLNLAIPLLINGVTYILIFFTLKKLDITKNIISLQNSILKVGIIVSVVGLILLVAYIIINKRKKEGEIAI